MSLLLYGKGIFAGVSFGGIHLGARSLELGPWELGVFGVWGLICLLGKAG